MCFVYPVLAGQGPWFPFDQHCLVALNFLYSVWVRAGEMPDPSVAGMEMAHHTIPPPAWRAPRVPRPQRPKGSRILRMGEQIRKMTRLVRGGFPVFVRCRRIGDAQHEGGYGGIS